MSYQAIKRHGGSLNAYYQVEEANLKGYILCDSNYVAFQKRQNCGDSKRSVVVSGGLGRDDYVKHRGFLGQ